jgi:hypothetical protein
MVKTRSMPADKEDQAEGLSYSDQLIKTFIDIAQQKLADLEKSANSLSDENADMKQTIETLQRKVQLQDGLIARLTSKTEQQEAQLTDLRARSMRDNIVIGGIAEDGVNENWDVTKRKVQNFLNKELKIADVNEVQIDRAHRSGVKGNEPRPIIAKLMNSSSKDIIFQHVKNLRGKPNFSIQEQLPAEVTECRKRLWNQYKRAKADPNNRVSWSLDKLVINGVTFSAYDDKHDLTTNNEIRRNIETVHTQHSVVDGSTFIGHAAEIVDRSDVPIVLARLMQDPMVAGATHNIFAYRFDDSAKPGGVTEHFSLYKSNFLQK